MSKPKRIQRRRSKGFKLPPDTICINRPTKWGNPFIVGIDGTQKECVSLFSKLCAGMVCVTSKASIKDQEESLKHLSVNIKNLKGKNLACFCKEETPCHGDILLILANL